MQIWIGGAVGTTIRRAPRPAL